MGIKTLKKQTDSLLKDQNSRLNDHIRELLSSSLKVSNKSAPEIYKSFTHCQKILGLEDKDILPFIYNSHEVNAYCSYSGQDIVIGLSSQLVKLMSKNELVFVIGHELGHALYEHYKLPASGLCQGSIPPSRTLQLMSWSRQAEISADRAGLICCNDISAATSGFIKMSSGLSEPYISLDIDDFVSQLDLIDNFETDDKANDCYSSHPLSPLRVIALKNFWNSKSFVEYQKNSNPNQIDDSEMDDKIFGILNFMEPKKNEQSITVSSNCDNFLIYSSYYVANADSELHKKELLSLKDLCDQKTLDIFLSDLSDNKQNADYLKELLKKESLTFKKSKKGIKCSTLQKIVTVARSDGELSVEERKALYYIANLINIDDSFVDQILKFLD